VRHMNVPLPTMPLQAYTSIRNSSLILPLVTRSSEEFSVFYPVRARAILFISPRCGGHADFRERFASTQCAAPVSRLVSTWDCSDCIFPRNSLCFG